MNKRRKWVRADKLQPGDRVQDAKGKIVTIKDVSQGIFPGSILITLQDADPDFLYLESDTKVFVEWPTGKCASNRSWSAWAVELRPARWCSDRLANKLYDLRCGTRRRLIACDRSGCHTTHALYQVAAFLMLSLRSVLSPVKLRVASLVRINRAIVENIVASTQNTGPRMLGQTGV
jgi:hypothetical protein